ncbi:MAG: class I SAM-dependent methyltransferase [Acidobacteriia bacterium]|nr:class I SAM-dependent methyltransferase [Terriglobia bacterium]
MRRQSLVDKMRRDWDQRARENYRHYIVNCRKDWSEEDFRASGEVTASHYILTDMLNICQGKRPEEMRVLDFGCGAGRVTRSLAKTFGEVHGVDISIEMVRLARQALGDMPNAHIHQTNGEDLRVLGDLQFDFAFAFSVFHHIPSKSIIENSIREVGTHLRSGCLFKFEVQGYLPLRASEDDTWLGVPLGEQDLIGIAERCGFESRHRLGAGEESYWQWFFRK